MKVGTLGKHTVRCSFVRLFVLQSTVNPSDDYHTRDVALLPLPAPPPAPPPPPPRPRDLFEMYLPSLPPPSSAPPPTPLPILLLIASLSPLFVPTSPPLLHHLTPTHALPPFHPPIPSSSHPPPPPLATVNPPFMPTLWNRAASRRLHPVRLRPTRLCGETFCGHGTSGVTRADVPGVGLFPRP